MKVKMVTVGLINNHEIEWPEGWPLPAKGECVDLPDEFLYVRHRAWYPVVDNNQEPYIYIVVEPRP